MLPIVSRFNVLETSHQLRLEFWRNINSFPYSFKENEMTLAGRAKSDAREMQSFYHYYYKNNIQALQNAADKHDRLVL